MFFIGLFAFLAGFVFFIFGHPSLGEALVVIGLCLGAFGLWLDHVAALKREILRLLHGNAGTWLELDEIIWQLRKRLYGDPPQRQVSVIAVCAALKSLERSGQLDWLTSGYAEKERTKYRLKPA